MPGARLRSAADNGFGRRPTISEDGPLADRESISIPNENEVAMRRFVIPILILGLLIGTASLALAEGPRVLGSKPSDGATGVPTNIGEISVFFSQPMDTGSWSLFEIEGLEYPPGKIEGPPWKDPRASASTSRS